MRFIHCADIHLDSRMTSRLPAEKARERRKEMLNTFRRLVQTAADEQADAVLIAGDLFDRKNFSRTSGETCLTLIRENPQIQFFYLRGNHDTGPFPEEGKSVPSNLHLFSGEHWTSCTVGQTGVTITGTELTVENQYRLLGDLQINPANCNIVMLHGLAEDSRLRASHSGKAAEPVIPLRSMAEKGIDYLALGHIHKPTAGKLGGRGIWCYSGCLEGRGFDECGDRGCMLVDLDPETHKAELKFLPLAARIFHEISVDVTSFENTGDILAAVRNRLKEEPCREQDFVRILLNGETELTYEIPLEVLNRQLNGLYYYLEIENRTKLLVDYRSYEGDPSLKGEFVRRVRRDSTLTEEQKTAILKLGIRLLTGADVYEDP
ncbi:MAG: exonuclease SbcCD subunit D [Lachnospiraceae bacterium]|nr:exonuclease SbcCD subunit D [Lachnospiraceae bacterium]